MKMDREVFRIDDVACWIEQQSSVHIKAVTKSGDPVELTSAEALKLGEMLIKFAGQIDSNDAGSAINI